MKICLVNPPVNPYFAALDFPVALLILGAMARKWNCETEIIDFNLLTKIDPHYPLCDSFFPAATERIGRNRPDLIGITCLSSSLPFALEISERYKGWDPKVKILLGGPQATLLGSLLLERYPFVDMVCRGEGEETLRDFLANDANPSGVAGLIYRTVGGQIVINPERAMMADLDQSPFPDYSLIDVPSYQRLTPKISLQIEAGRGCPYHCTYCSTSLVWGNLFRLKSVERVIAEIQSTMETTGIRNIHLIHDLFSLDKEWVFTLCRQMKSLIPSLSWNCDTRIDAVSLEMLEAMHQAGCRGLFFGLESRSLEMQKVFRKVWDPEAVTDLLPWMEQNDMLATFSFILGYPCEGLSDLEKTLEFILLLQLLHPKIGIVINSFQPEYGTEAYRIYSSELRPSPGMIQRDMPFTTPEIIARITKDPEVFSHFYSIENRHYDYAWVERFQCILPLVWRLDLPSRLFLHHSRLSYTNALQELYRSVQPAMRMDEYRRPFYDEELLSRGIQCFRQCLQTQYGIPMEETEVEEQTIRRAANILNQWEETGRGVYDQV